ncbi:MAG TPA: hypothetical protein PLI39_04250 [Petrotogaceae bacterium]|jgi:small-conductance mechanosensitive channel|nr:hypothetical protein [Petrotogaceae bacterium]HOG35061.1 hypothetical protein [Petrotogaceae bacterium]HPA93108.1 hypothetical protein [Petrotogaceae bacterium]HPG48590.1 hypothetical protein [Petrotogaceae bacterium]HPO28055.1 hypothetical protein [Petrotogaceae bacterium]
MLEVSAKKGRFESLKKIGNGVSAFFKFLSKPAVLWITSIAVLLVFSLVVDIQWLIIIPVIVATFSKQWLAAMLTSFVRGTGIFGMISVSMLWITFGLLVFFIYGIYTFFFDSKKFLKIKRK